MKRWIVGCAVSAAAVLMAACASSAGSGPGGSVLSTVDPGTTASPVVAPAVPPSQGPPAQNKSAARAEAERLVAGAVLTPGARRTADRPAQLVGPAMGLPGTSHLIDRAVYYRVTMSLSQTHAWFQSHPQRGFSQDGTSSSSSTGVTGYGFGYAPRPRSHWAWGSAELEIGLAPASPTATDIRVDGMALWIDPTPTKDISHGATVRVRVSGGCPATDRGIMDVRNPGDPDLGRYLLPANAPAAARECAYGGLNGAVFMLTSNRVLGRARATHAADLIRTLPLGSSGDGPHSCPMDDNRVRILAFSYTGRADIDILEHVSGCGFTDNGHIVSDSFSGGF